MNLKKILTLAFAVSLTVGSVHAAKEQPTSAQSNPSAPDSSAADSPTYEPLYQKWLAANPADRKKIAPDVWAAIVSAFSWDDNNKSDYFDIIRTLQSNGQLAQKTIQLPLTTNKIAVRILQKFSHDLRNQFYEELRNSKGNVLSRTYSPWVIRRMTKDRFELWEAWHGYLFNGDGKRLATANVHRKDGDGREWYGAFLADGRWATTDLESFDGQFSIFSRNGKLLKSIASKKLVTLPKDSYSGDHIIAWARCDRVGKSWIACVGANGGDGIAQIFPNGEHHELKNPAAPWQLIYPHDLEPKGDPLSWLSIPSDDDVFWLNLATGAHGDWLAFPCCSLSSQFLDFWNDYDPHIAQNIPNTLWQSQIYQGSHNFGFWRKSHHFYISDTPYAAAETWFYNAKGDFEGFLAAWRLGEAADHTAQIFANDDDKIITLTSQMKVTEIRQFVLPDGTALVPVKIFDDLHLGFFHAANEKVPDQGDAPILLVSWKL